MTILNILVPLVLGLYLAGVLVRGSRFKIHEHEKLVVFRLGRPVAMRDPGTVWLLPIVESGVKLSAVDAFEARRIADYKRQFDHNL